MKKVRAIWSFGVIALTFILCSASFLYAASISIDVADEKGDVNYGVLGNNTIGYHSTSYQVPHYIDGSGVWDTINKQSFPKMVEAARNIGVSYSRFPGGCGVHFYDWKESVGPINTRPVIYDGNKTEFGLPEYLQYTEDIGSTPLYTLSDYTGTADDAADLVKYLNADCEAPCTTDINNQNDFDNICGGLCSDGVCSNWQQARVCDKYALGRSDLDQPWNAVWFEYGNETHHGTFHHVSDGSGQGMTAEEYADNYLDYRSAMTTIDPGIKLGAVLQHISRGIANDWDLEVILNTGQLADFYITHSYIPRYRDNCCETDDTDCQTSTGYPVCENDANSIFTIGLAGVNGELQNYYHQLNNLIIELTKREDIPIAITEFNGAFVQSDPVPYRHVLGNALVNAELIRQLMHAENIGFANYWQFANSYWGMVDSSSGIYKMRPNYYPFDFYHNHFGDILINPEGTDVVSDEYETDGGHGVSPAYGTFQEEVVDPVNLLNGNWVITTNTGVSASEDNGILTIDFDGMVNVDYHNSKQTINVEADTWYRLSGLIKTNNLSAGEGVYLEVQDINAVNLVTNNGFEDDFSEWSLSDNSDNVGTTRGIDTESYTGSKSPKVYFDGSADNNYYHITQYLIDVQPDTTYTIEGFIKTDSIDYPSTNSWNGIMISVDDARGYTYGAWSMDKTLKGTNDWTHVSKAFTTKSDTAQVKVRLRRISGGGVISGTAWWDDIRLSKKIETKSLDGSSDWRYVYTDINTGNLNNPTALSVIAGGNARGDGMQNKYAMFKDVKLQKITPANNGEVPFLSVNASKSSDGSRVYLMVVNKDMVNSIDAPITLDNFTPSSARAWTLSGASVDACIDVSLGCDPNKNIYVDNINIGPVTTTMPYTFPPHSLTALEIRSCTDMTGYLIAGGPCSWKYRQEITVSSNLTGADLYNFPLLININDQDNDLFDKAQSIGEDIAFTLDDGTKLDHEIEGFNTSAGSRQLVAWVRVPVLSSRRRDK